METEIWKEIPSCPDYFASNLGRIKSTKRDSPKILKLAKTATKPPYKQFAPTINGKCKSRTVHRAVLEAFIGECPEGMEACHIDGNSLNNKIDNLRWDTRSNNSKDKIIHGTCPLTKLTGTKKYNSKLNKTQLLEILDLLDKGAYQRDIAKMYGVSQPVICDINRGISYKEDLNQ